jgi:membrane-bound lytic murein transglycosylase B
MKNKTSHPYYKLIPVIFLIFSLAFASTGFAQDVKKGTELNNVVDRLVKDGFDRDRVEALFAKDSVYFTTNGVNTFFSYYETSGDPYLKFTKPSAIENTHKYMVAHEATLDQAQKIYGVDKTIIAAILLVESWLGTYPIEHPAINILATIAAMNDPKLQEKIWDSIPKKRKPKRASFKKKIGQRMEWGYNELKALLKYTQQQGFAPETIKGSFAGAIGYPQFMPSNALTLARDGDNDGKIDLFTHPDAIYSVANYLKHHGWKPGLSRQIQHEVLFRYNHSNYYVDTLLKISDKLKDIK